MNATLSEFVTKQLNTGVLIIDSQRNIVFSNRFIEVHSGKSSGELLNKNIYQEFNELPQRWLERKIESVTQLKTPAYCSWEQRHHLFELPHTRPITTNSKFMAQNCTFLPVQDNGVVVQVCILIEDVTDVCHYQQMLNKTLEDLAMANRIDGLTQVFNRRHWEECMAQEFARARRYKHDVSLIMIDLDRFKLINDNYGHQAGDLVLIESAKYIKSMLRISDIFGRYGGEEFCVILPETDLIGAADVAERIREGFQHLKLGYNGIDIPVTISVGVTNLVPTDTRYEDMISRADAALYQSKANGRNQMTIHQHVVEYS